MTICHPESLQLQQVKASQITRSLGENKNKTTEQPRRQTEREKQHFGNRERRKDISESCVVLQGPAIAEEEKEEQEEAEEEQEEGNKKNKNKAKIK